MDYRPYQIEYIDNIQINKSNLVISPMRSGKSVIIKGIIPKYINFGVKFGKLVSLPCIFIVLGRYL